MKQADGKHTCEADDKKERKIERENNVSQGEKYTTRETNVNEKLPCPHANRGVACSKTAKGSVLAEST